MKNFFWAAGSVIVSVILAVLIASGNGDGKSGAVNYPSTNFDYLVVSKALGFLSTSGANVDTMAVRSALVATSSIPCVLQNPFNATSTITSFAFNVSQASSSATSLVVGTSTTATATSSSMTSQTIAANAQATVTWDPPINNATVGPSQWITGGVTGMGATTLGGSCSASFISAT